MRTIGGNLRVYQEAYSFITLRIKCIVGKGENADDQSNTKYLKMVSIVIDDVFWFIFQ